MTRNGKIARLPWSIRGELNLRLRDGEPGTNLVAWLNGLPAVQEVLRKEFAGRPINEQNLSEWRQGGYEDWLRHQETRAWVQELACQSADISQDIKEEVGDLSVAELLTAQLAMALGRCLQSVTGKATDDPKQVQALLDVARELNRLRRGDQSQERFRFERERWREEFKLKLQTLLSKGNKPIFFHDFLIQTLVESQADALNKQINEKKKRGSLSPEEEARYQEALAKLARWRSDPREARANQSILFARAGSSDPQTFNNGGVNQTGSNPTRL